MRTLTLRGNCGALSLIPQPGVLRVEGAAAICGRVSSERPCGCSHLAVGPGLRCSPALPQAGAGGPASAVACYSAATTLSDGRFWPGLRSLPAHRLSPREMETPPYEGGQRLSLRGCFTRWGGGCLTVCGCISPVVTPQGMGCYWHLVGGGQR